MTAVVPPPHPAWKRGTQWLYAGGLLGAVGGLVALGLPITFVYLAKYNPGGFFVFAPALVQLTSAVVLMGSVLVMASFFCYSWSYSVLRRTHHGFWGPYILYFIGSSGLILIAVAAAFATGGPAALEACVKGSYSNALSCIDSASPIVAYAGTLGFWLGWVGGIGLAVGLFLASRSFRSVGYRAAGALYALLLVVLVGPFVGLLYPVPYVTYLLAAVPVLAILAPAFVVGARPTIPASAVSPEPGAPPISGLREGPDS